jgi:hypothetical protein
MKLKDSVKPAGHYKPTFDLVDPRIQNPVKYDVEEFNGVAFNLVLTVSRQGGNAGWTEMLYQYSPSQMAVPRWGLADISSYSLSWVA